MAPKRRVMEAGSSSQSRRRQNSPPPPPQRQLPNEYGIEFRDADQYHRYQVLLSRRIMPTRYIDTYALNLLGLLLDVMWMCGRVGWTRFLTLQFPTYYHLTFEFLSSVIFHSQRGDNYLSFRLMNNEHTLTMEQFNGIFGFPMDGDQGLSRDFSAHSFWRDISGQYNYNASRAKATLIHNPCFRYVQRFMAHTIFGRGDSDGVVRQSELYIMWGMIREHPIDTGFFLVKQMIKMAVAQKGEIVIGGLITPIARHFHIDLTHMDIVPGNTRIDIESLIAMKMIKKEGMRYQLVFRDSEFRMMLPQPIHTSVQNEGNWLYDLETDQVVDDAVEPPVEEPLEVDEEGAEQTATDIPEFHPPPQPTFASLQASIREIQADQRAIREEQDRQGKLLDAIYNWHLSQGHFGPSTP